ncbi:hypothetical protein BDK51DRAFT_31698 [Blyttiomyces helicus]|uniref:Uncharacterized protein n=1 Tax=Blyttiomyces helicus TaxID=388810 RepID=A0A4P9WC57_9FUNG|nr:hypothetical protein BDK51DRAFT_31698 [Blyttiomyces helicus]|eukprot:RKO89892.1 hypothetical protein BDK51DRAFT_31698 [Blyttiomyces helicus]
MAAPGPTLNATDYANISDEVISEKSKSRPNPLDSVWILAAKVHNFSIDTGAEFLLQMEDFLKQYMSPAPPHSATTPLPHHEIVDIFQAYLAGTAKTWAYQIHQEYTTGSPPSRFAPMAVDIWAIANEFLPKNVNTFLRHPTPGCHFGMAIVTLEESLTTLGQPSTPPAFMNFRGTTYQKLAIVAINAPSGAEYERTIKESKYLQSLRRHQAVPNFSYPTNTRCPGSTTVEYKGGLLGMGAVLEFLSGEKGRLEVVELDLDKGDRPWSTHRKLEPMPERLIRGFGVGSRPEMWRAPLTLSPAALT